jgi:hypothetical protein
MIYEIVLDVSRKIGISVKRRYVNKCNERGCCSIQSSTRPIARNITIYRVAAASVLMALNS